MEAKAGSQRRQIRQLAVLWRPLAPGSRQLAVLWRQDPASWRSLRSLESVPAEVLAGLPPGCRQAAASLARLPPWLARLAPGSRQDRSLRSLGAVPEEPGIGCPDQDSGSPAGIPGWRPRIPLGGLETASPAPKRPPQRKSGLPSENRQISEILTIFLKIVVLRQKSSIWEVLAPPGAISGPGGRGRIRVLPRGRIFASADAFFAPEKPFPGAF